MSSKKLNKLVTLLKDPSAWLALCAGLALTFAYAPFNIWPIGFVAIAIACYCTDRENIKEVAKYGFIFSFAWFAAGISWVHVSIAQFGGLPLPISLLMMALLCAYLALYPTLAFICAPYFSRTPWQRICLLIASFAIFEFLRGTLLTGFPWLSFGYILTDSPLNLFAPLIGEMGLTLVCILLGASLYYGLKLRDIKPTLVAAAILVSLFTLHSVLPSPTYSKESVKALLVQGNIEQSLRWEPEQFWPTMSKYRDMTRLHWQDVDLVVWPEAAIPEIEDIAYPFLEGLDKAAVFNNTALITGIPDYQFSSKTVFNSLIVLGKQNKHDTEGHYQYLHKNRYQKHQLLPIGEFVPFEDLLRPIAPLFNLAMSSFNRGERVQTNLLANGLRILPAICYEIAFSELVRDNFTHESDILFTVSNDEWFGDSHGPHQHMQIARMRSLELQRPLIRVTNNGITGVFDPISGHQITLAQFESNILKTELKLVQGNSIYSQYGQKPIWLLVSILLLYIVVIRAKAPLMTKVEKYFL